MKVRAKKSLGQNFLQDKAVVRRIADALDLTEGDAVIEIGPGTGALTRQLAGLASRLIAVEFDRDLIPALKKEFEGARGFELLTEDALNLKLAELGEENFKIAANLPYNIATPILQRLAAQRERIAVMVLMFQREVVERIAAPAGIKERGYLSVLAQNAFKVEKLFDVPPTAFSPVPKVWSSVVRLTPKPIPADEDEFLRLVSASFAQRRKILSNNLKAVLPNVADILGVTHIDPSRRAETLTLDEWRDLFAAIKNAGPSEAGPAS